MCLRLRFGLCVPDWLGLRESHTLGFATAMVRNLGDSAIWNVLGVGQKSQRVGGMMSRPSRVWFVCRNKILQEKVGTRL
ncbi:hypothetical protein CCP4SC76_7960002 [Gammaproteobacteria bacterium]